MASGSFVEDAGTAGCAAGPPPLPELKTGGPHGLALEKRIERVISWLRSCELTDVKRCSVALSNTRDILSDVMGAATRTTFQQQKSFKHRIQIESIAAHCLHFIPASCDVIVEMGAGQAVLGHTVSIASGLPLVAIERRGNVSVFDVDSLQGKHGEVPVSSIVQGDIADDSTWPQSGNVTLLAKHLCGHSSDIAVDRALRLGPRLSLLCLAPCCHQTMSWMRLAPESQEWFEQARCCADLHEFSMLVNVVQYYYNSLSDQSKYVPCSKWKLRRFVSSDEAVELGRRACRTIDEARLARLRGAGLEVLLVEYCDSAVTPDNVLILAAPAGRLQLAQVAPLSVPACGLGRAKDARYGILLELDPTSPLTLGQRVVAYLYEQQTNKFTALQVVLPMADASSAHSPAVRVAAADGKGVLTLLQQLMACPLIRRAVTRLIPFDQEAADLPAMARLVCTQLVSQDPPGKVRVLARPKKLADAICKVFGAEYLSPAGFSHTLYVTASDDLLLVCKDVEANAEVPAAGISASLRYALIPREAADVAAWAIARTIPGTTENRTFWRFAEVAERWPSRIRADGVAIWTDCPDPVAWFPSFASRFLPRDAHRVELRVVTPTSPDAAPGNVRLPVAREVPKVQVKVGCDRCSHGTLRASLLLVDISYAGDEVVESLQTVLLQCARGADACLAQQGTVCMRLRTGRKARAVKKWVKDISQLLESRLGAKHADLFQLLGDKDPERTVLVSWDMSLMEG